MKRKSVVLVVVLLIVALVGYSAYLSNRKVYVGFAAGLSGQWSQLGVQVRNGFLQAVDDINAQGGINGHEVVPVIIDDKNDNTYAQGMLDQLNENDVDFFVGFSVSSMTPTIEYFMDNSDMLIISPTMSTNSLSGLDDNFIRICNASSEEAYKLVEMLKDESLHEFSVLYDVSNRPYTEPLHDIIVENTADSDLKLVLDRPFNSHEDDYDLIVEDVIKSQAKQVVILASGVDTADLVQRLRIKGSEAIFYSSAWSTTRDLLENGGKAIEGMRVVGLYDIASERPEYHAFRQTMMDKFDADPTFSQIFGYESLLVLKKAVERADSFKVEDVKRTIIETSEFQGLQQKLKFNAYGDMERDYFTYEIENGQFVDKD